MSESRPPRASAPTTPKTPSEGSPAIRWLVHRLAHRCLHWSFRDVRVFGAERIPTDGPLLLIGNHPNDLPDVLQGFFVTPRPLRYIATLSAASSWPARKIYEGLGVIPVVRVRDARAERRKGTDMKAVNAAAGNLVAEALSAGHAVGVFPEGGVHNVPYVGKPRAGVVRMLLEYPIDGAKDVTIVSFGVQYESPHRPGSDCCAVIGRPFSLGEWRRDADQMAGQRDAESAADPNRPRAHAADLAATLHEALRAVTRNAPTWSAAEARDRVIAAVAAGQGARDPLANAIGLVCHAEALAAPDDPGSTWALPVRMQTIADDLSTAVERAGGIGTSARDHADLRGALEGTATMGAGMLWTTAPIAAAGWLVHGPVFAVVWRLARKLAKAPVDLIALTYLPGLYLVLIWYLMLTALLGIGFHAGGISAWWAVPFLLLAPRLGDWAVAWRHRWRRARFMARVRAWPVAERQRLATAYVSLVALWTESDPDSPPDSIKLPHQSRSADSRSPSAGSQQA
ncbi:MAG TPA: lysophospholipid acyltransferase family protein [Gemmatimonas sp.]|uniref:lysophospholipid acyltransferase family protein n=1 Tax=Gemmatimonas sp. TaxID=1962908 RepID=UPI002ED87F98